MKQVQLKTLKQGDTFKRKADAKKVFIREHYNRADAFGPANYTCTDYSDIGRDVFLKGSTLVFVGFEF